MRYQRLKAGAIVYTVGYNEIDDGGWGHGWPRAGDLVFLLGRDDRPHPTGYHPPWPMIPGRKIKLDDYEELWTGKHLSLAGEKVFQEEFAAVSSITTLEWLDLGAADLPDQWYERLPRLQNLRTLSLTGIELTSDALEHVAKLPALQTLVLNGTDVTGILQPIAGIPRLHTLDLSRSSVKDDDLTALIGLTNLRTLMLNDTDITDAAAPLIAQLSGVRALDLSGTQITDAGVAEIAALDALEVLRLDFTGVTNAGIASLRMETLRELSLSGTSVDNGVAESLTHFPDLSALSVYDTKFDTQFDREDYEQFLAKVGHNVTLKGLKVWGELRDSPDLPSKIQNVQWGTLSGREGGYKVLQDDTQLQVKLFSPNMGSDSRYSDAANNANVGQVTVLRPVVGDFDVRVKVIPDWEQHDWMMTRETRGSGRWQGGPDLSAGLIIQVSPRHLFRWSWNSVDSNSGVHSRITPEYSLFSSGITEQVQGERGLLESSGDDSMLLNTFSPHETILGSYKYFDSEFFWLRLQRRGNMVTSLLSTDGETWKVTAKMRVHFGNEVQVGVWCKRIASSPYVFTFEDFQLSP
jgi:hypothetical protein